MHASIWQIGTLSITIARRFHYTLVATYMAPDEEILCKCHIAR